jgi:HK97 family phage major capsid protein
VTWTPKTCGAFSDMTRKFILQTNQDAEALVREDLSKQLAIELDRVGLNGSGVGAQPLGVMNDPNVPVLPLGTDGGPPDWPTVVNLEKLVAQANAEFGRLGYVTSNAGRAKMKQTPKVATPAYPIFLWEADRPADMANGAEGAINGYRAMATEQMPSNLTKGAGTGLTGLVYGNWESATYAFWSALDMLVDPYTGGSAGTVRIIGLIDCDVQFRWEQAFAKCNDLNPA